MTQPEAIGNRPGSSGSTYQVVLVALLSLNFGIVFFDRNALNFLMPWVQPDLGLTNAQVGLTASALSLTWALSGLIFGAMSDLSGRRKAYLLAGTVLYLGGNMAVTLVCNVPRNESLAAMAPAHPKSAGAWTRYVASWTAWNHVRTAAALAAAAAFTAALVR